MTCGRTAGSICGSNKNTTHSRPVIRKVHFILLFFTYQMQSALRISAGQWTIDDGRFVEEPKSRKIEDLTNHLIVKIKKLNPAICSTLIPTPFYARLICEIIYSRTPSCEYTRFNNGQGGSSQASVKLPQPRAPHCTPALCHRITLSLHRSVALLSSLLSPSQKLQGRLILCTGHLQRLFLSRQLNWCRKKSSSNTS